MNSNTFKWEPIPEMNNDYVACREGFIKSVRLNRVLKGTLDKDGYLIVSTRLFDKEVKRKVHRLIAKTFVPNPENKPQVNHLDCCRANNRADNLVWGTQQEDVAYKVSLNRQAVGNHFPDRKRGSSPSAKIVLDTQTGIYYDCVSDAADAKDIKANNLYPRLRGTIPNNTSLIYV